MPEHKNLTAGSDWKSVSLPIKALADAFPDSGFSLDNLWYVSVTGIAN